MKLFSFKARCAGSDHLSDVVGMELKSSWGGRGDAVCHLGQNFDLRVNL